MKFSILCYFKAATIPAKRSTANFQDISYVLIHRNKKFVEGFSFLLGCLCILEAFEKH